MIEALRERRNKIRFILVRHEEGAAFSACGYAKFTGQIGVCLSTTGPGGIHLLNGLYDAHLDHTPVLAITGRTYSDLIGSEYQQDVDLTRPFADVARFNHTVMNASHAQMAVDLALKSAILERDVAHISIPIDVQNQELSKDQESEHKVRGLTSPNVPPRSVPDKTSLQSAAKLLNEGHKVVLMVGAGALDAGPEVLELARKLNAPIVKSLLGKAVVPDDDPNVTGGLGLLGTAPSQDAMEEADTLFMIGTSYPYSEYLPKPGQAAGVQLDVKPENIGIRYPVEIGLVGDSKMTLQQLLPLVNSRKDDAFQKRMREKTNDWWNLMQKRGTRNNTPLKPQVVAWTLSDLLADNAIICVDSGTITTWAARYIRTKNGQMFSCSGTLASMANAISYAVGAQVAYPDRQVVAFVGDGGFTMLMCEFATATYYKLPIKVIVIKNGSLGMIRWEQIGFLGNPEYAVNFQNIDFVKFAEATGAKGYRVDTADQVKPVLEEALSVEGPALVEAVVDPNEPIYPAKMKFEYVENFAKALARGQPNRKRIALTLYRDKIKEL